MFDQDLRDLAREFRAQPCQETAQRLLAASARAQDSTSAQPAKTWLFGQELDKQLRIMNGKRNARTVWQEKLTGGVPDAMRPTAWAFYGGYPPVKLIQQRIPRVHESAVRVSEKWVATGESVKCELPTCQDGKIMVLSLPDDLDAFVTAKDCQVCHGSGRKPSDPGDYQVTLEFYVIQWSIMVAPGQRASPNGPTTDRTRRRWDKTGEVKTNRKTWNDWRDNYPLEVM